MLVVQALEMNSWGGVGVCFFLSFFGFLGWPYLFSFGAIFRCKYFWDEHLCWKILCVSFLRFDCGFFLLSDFEDSRRGDFCWFGFVWGLNACRRMFVEVFLPRNWVGSREKILGIVMATQNLATQSLYESASHPQRDASTFLEFNTQGDVNDYPEFTELCQLIHPLVWNNHIGSGNINFWRELSLWPKIQN